MRFVFPDAPAQDGRGELVIKFRQFFYLVNMMDGRGMKGFEGAVVLLPSTGHAAVLSMDGSTLALSGAQVDIFWASEGGKPAALSVSGLRTEAAGSANLVKSSVLFERAMPIQKGLLSDRVVPKHLNARVVLADGFLEEETPARPEADIEWEFHRPGEQVVTHKLTDRMTYHLGMRAGYRYWVVISNGSSISAAFAVHQGGTTAEVHNLDIRGPNTPVELPPKPYTLDEFADLHQAVLILRAKDHGVMKGELRSVFKTLGTAEPICGGEQGDPDPPEDPPDPPSP